MHELVPYLRLILRRRWRLTLGGLLMLLTLLAGIGLLALSGWFITATAVVAALWAAGAHTAFDVYIPGGTIRAFALTRTVARYFERLYNHDTVLRLLVDLRGGVFAALTRLEPVTLERLRSGILLNRLTADVDALDNLYLRLLAPPAVAMAALLAVAALLVFLVPTAGFTALLVGAALFLFTTLVSARRGLACSGQLLQQAETLRIRLIEQFQGLAELSAYGSLADHRRRVANDEQTLLSNQRRLGRQTATGNALVTLGIQLLAAIVLVLGLLIYESGEVSAAVAVILPLAVMALAEAFQSLPAAFTHYGHTRAAAERLTAELQRPEQLPAVMAATELPDRFAVQLENLGYRYDHAEKPVLANVSLTIAPGERVAIVAESGAGKSTLADLLAGLRRPTSGSIYLGHCNLAGLDLIQLSKSRGYLTQRSDLFEASIADNLRVAAPNASDAELRQVLLCVALDEWVAGLTNGLQTWIGESGRRISGGEGRRLALARLLLGDPALVLLDEPFRGLDQTTSEQVAHRLQGWLQGRTAVFFAHAADALPAADRTYELRQGRLQPLQ